MGCTSCVVSVLILASALLEEKKRFMFISLVYGVFCDFLRQSESTRPYPWGPLASEKLRFSIGQFNIHVIVVGGVQIVVH